MKPKFLNEMDSWEEEVDNINWRNISEEIDQALIDHLAAEVGFPSYDKLEQASELVVDDYYICHRSDGMWIWWNPQTYASEDPKYFNSQSEAMHFVADFLDLNEEKRQHLKVGFDQVNQTKQCNYCDHEFNPHDPSRHEWDREAGKLAYCSPECAMDAVMEEMKEKS
ncbi:hypothetical protein [Risungbinella massiliensis]|uniref:hypothetical protein n=1 Tax=Risungbinella massiliensis TaxID=1329796 RepID=UPI0005CBCC4C|nr:hypothetical protein [Risungbinella massiliensis]